MHIQFKKIRYKNILSVGNQFIEIDFEQARTSIISGKNGAGKSTMLEAIVFALFGKPFRKVNKPQLVNSINQKDLLIELEFTAGGDHYEVKRGMKPTVFEISKNGNALDKDAASRDFQTYFEEDILKMSYKAFTQIVILGSATYTPFMDLTTGQRREIIEDLLDIQVFSTMNNLLKEKISFNKESLNETSHSVTLLRAKIEAATNHNAEIKKLKETEVSKIKDKIKDLLGKMSENTDKMAPLQEDYDSKKDNLPNTSSLQSSKREMESILYDLRSKRKLILTETKFYEDHDNCPTCNQEIDKDFKTTSLKTKREECEKLESAILKLESKISKLDDKLEEIQILQSELQKISNQINEFKLSNNMIKDQLKSIKAELLNAEREVEEVDQSKIIEYGKELDEFVTKQRELNSEREILAVVSTMLKDGGIKASIIKTYIPVMNKIINQYLSEFELFVDFNLKEDFSETIKSRFRDTFSFSSFSEGEKLRISMSILFAWRALAKLRNSVSTNLLILDETLDGSSDAEGVEALIEILKKLNSNDNVFVISHRGENFGEKFDRHIQFQKIKNFTQLVA